MAGAATPAATPRNLRRVGRESLMGLFLRRWILFVSGFYFNYFALENFNDIRDEGIFEHAF